MGCGYPEYSTVVVKVKLGKTISQKAADMSYEDVGFLMGRVHSFQILKYVLRLIAKIAKARPATRPAKT